MDVLVLDTRSPGGISPCHTFTLVTGQILARDWLIEPGCVCLQSCGEIRVSSDFFFGLTFFPSITSKIRLSSNYFLDLRSFFWRETLKIRKSSNYFLDLVFFFGHT